MPSLEEELRLLVGLAEYNCQVLREHALEGGHLVTAALEETTLSLKQLQDHLAECLANKDVRHVSSLFNL